MLLFLLNHERFSWTNYGKRRLGLIPNQNRAKMTIKCPLKSYINHQKQKDTLSCPKFNYSFGYWVLDSENPICLCCFSEIWHKLFKSHSNTESHFVYKLCFQFHGKLAAITQPHSNYSHQLYSGCNLIVKGTAKCCA